MKVREKIRFEWLRVRGSEDDVGLLRREAVLGAAEWKRAARKVLADRMSLPAVGIHLKGVLLVRPGRLGEFLRVFPSCRLTTAPSASLRVGRDPMPLPILEESLAESRLAQELCVMQEKGAGVSRKEALKKRSRMRRLREEAGFGAWIWLAVMVANYMFCEETLGKRGCWGTWADAPRSRRKCCGDMS